jgi:hypothetical protein
MNKPVFAEVSEDWKYIEIFFQYDPDIVSMMHSCHAQFIEKTAKANPYPGHSFWRMRLDLEDARLLADTVGRDKIALGDAIKQWGTEEVARQEQILKLALASTGTLERLPSVLPKLYKATGDRKYQRAIIRFGVFVRRLLNASQPGMGKTLEGIGTVFEDGWPERPGDVGANLVIAPLTSLEDVWFRELHRWQDAAVLVAGGEGMPRIERERVLYEAGLAHEAGIPFWLVVNPKMVQLKREKAQGIGEDPSSWYRGPAEEVRDSSRTEKLISPFPWIHEVLWDNVIVDEAAKNALRHPEKVTAKGIQRVKVAEHGLIQLMTGTPAGGKPINLWGLLNYLDPDRFSSKWSWIYRWLEVSENRYGADVGDVRPERQEAFDRYHIDVIIRHTKAEHLKELPPKDYVPVWVKMTPAQEKQYREFERRAEIKIADEKLTATSILAEYTRLKQFAGARQNLSEGRLTPTTESGKLAALIEHLEELGIMDGEGDAQTVIFSQFETIVTMVTDYLIERGVPTLKITGKVNKRGERSRLMRQFQDEKAGRVMVMTTTAGGMAITLDNADTVHILDETWDPDDQEQAEDRVHRASRIHQVTAYYYRTKGTIEEDINITNLGKKGVNKKLLDNPRVLFRARDKKKG